MRGQNAVCRGIEMTQAERRKYLIMAFLKEQPQYSKIEIPLNEQEQKILLRSLLNIVCPACK